MGNELLKQAQTSSDPLKPSQTRSNPLKQAQEVIFFTQND